ncbi:hypothetical protein FIBSPDRAFT_858229 [Athelia psychrophila]|uniref:Uncharacterized protein n=1 Tax=Athelia psychrophila TaxID=1759441 RepID=A0A166M5K9_9AGAM|nr:hypothetical protein FIBSPDRAFT_879553 [Fibularhizoctonia sp. CBS 109695]KZP23658.1 hypothetical protein FIBSPDRAFT_858229 [Fibularhizoctonia sp. CBS 109695]
MGIVHHARRAIKKYKYDIHTPAEVRLPARRPAQSRTANCHLHLGCRCGETRRAARYRIYGVCRF